MLYSSNKNIVFIVKKFLLKLDELHSFHYLLAEDGKLGSRNFTIFQNLSKVIAIFSKGSVFLLIFFLLLDGSGNREEGTKVDK